jgi:hypothetical protein
MSPFEIPEFGDHETDVPAGDALLQRQEDLAETWFPALIYDVELDPSGLYRYSWVELIVNPATGEYQTMDGGRAGSSIGNSLLEMNNLLIDIGTYPPIFPIRLRGMDPNTGSMFYEYSAGQGAAPGTAPAPPTAPSEFFVAKLTAVDSTQSPIAYAWKEQRVDPSTGNYVDGLPGSRSGTTTHNPAVDIGNTITVSLPRLVFLREQVGEPTARVQYEFTRSYPSLALSDGTGYSPSVPYLKLDINQAWTIAYDYSGGPVKITLGPATPTIAGTVSTGAQSWHGIKTFLDGATIGPQVSQGSYSIQFNYKPSTGANKNATIWVPQGDGTIETYTQRYDNTLGGSYLSAAAIPTFSIYAKDAALNYLNASYAAYDVTGTAQIGKWATVSGLTFCGGLYVSGSITGGGPPSGPAGGDLTGTYPNPTLRNSAAWSVIGNPPATPGHPVDIQFSADGQFLVRRASIVQADTIKATDLTGITAGGDRTGTYPNPTLRNSVATSVIGAPAAAGHPVDIGFPQDGEFLVRRAGTVQADFIQAADVPQFLTVAPGGRLTLTSGLPITINDVVGATTLYYTPFLHNGISLWTGSRWVVIAFPETSLAIGTLTGVPYDVFGYLTGTGQPPGSYSLALALVAWSGLTTRATQLVLTDGRYTLTGDKTRLYLGTIAPTGALQLEDSKLRRFVYNFYNRATRYLTQGSVAGHNYLGGWRYWNNDPTQRVEFVLGFDQVIPATVQGEVQQGANSQGLIGVCLDANNTATFFFYNYSTGASDYFGGSSTQPVPVGPGYHYMASVEKGVNSAASFADGAVYVKLES